MKLWLGASRADVRRFPARARRVAGFQLWRIQIGLEPNDGRPMPTVGPAVTELRVHAGTEHRVLYVARFLEGVYVLHAFEKRTWKTTRHDLGIARERWRLLLAERRRRKG